MYIKKDSVLQSTSVVGSKAAEEKTKMHWVSLLDVLKLYIKHKLLKYFGYAYAVDIMNVRV